ncbi:histone [Halobaculum sp. WSA2]|uniref:Histone n=1 Tax=Halobaculum saliterrae TaxID=2073113 RepID=A0A6B0SMV8_9EURY|nr:histone [Halobaculum saliterrae]MXR40065.1 histone [Halobaculum saliterrae]
MEFSIRSMSILLKQETDKRVSESAANQLGEVLEKFSEDIASDAISLAAEEGYQTVKQEHIKTALDQYLDREIQQSYFS